MKYIFIFIITLYQTFISPLLHSLLGVKNACRYSVTCSEYAKRSFKKYGVRKGFVLSAKRLLSCNPFSIIESNGRSI